MKWYNIELTKVISGELKCFLHERNIVFETSGCGDLVHFEIYASKNQATMIDLFLDTLYM